MLYKRSKQLGQGLYLVEISTNQSHLFIAAFDVETDESLLIELPEKKANDILEEFNHDYEQLASSLQVLNKRLVLLNPKFIQQKRVGTAPVLGREGSGRDDGQGFDATNASHLQQQQQQQPYTEQVPMEGEQDPGAAGDNGENFGESAVDNQAVYEQEEQ